MNYWMQKPPLGSQLNATHFARPDDLWLFNEGSGVIVNSLANATDSGILTNGPEWVPGAWGTAIRFDTTTNKYITIADQDWLTPPSNFTLGAALQWNGTIGNNIILNKAGVSGTREWQLTIDTNNGGLRFVIGSDGNWTVIYTAGAITANVLTLYWQRFWGRR